MSQISELLDLHDDLDELFFRHQSALLHFDFDRSLMLLEAYEGALMAHMRDEEDILMPVYRERAEHIKGGGCQLFLDEHFKMAEFIKLLKVEIGLLRTNREPDAKLIFVLDNESFYKRLSSHHDKRERDIFYPEIDRITSETEKMDLLKLVKRSLDLFGPAAKRAATDC